MAIPHYASIKFQNTVRLLEQARDVKRHLLAGKKTVSAKELLDIDGTISALSLKEQVLGYLEDLTHASFHKRRLTNDDLAQYTEWILSDSPESSFPIDDSPRAYARLQYLRGYIRGAADPVQAKQEILRSMYVESRPEVDLTRVENLVLAGGGAKAFSLAGVIQAVEDYQRSAPLPIKRVAGTSGGAIMAMGYAIGYSAQELDLLVNQNTFGLFTLESRLNTPWLNQMALWFARDDHRHALHVLSDNSIANTYHKSLVIETVEWLVSQGQAKDFDDCVSWISSSADLKEDRIHRIIKSIPGDALLDIDAEAQRRTLRVYPFLAKEGGVHLYSEPQQAFRTAFREAVGIDRIRGFFCDLIYEKLSGVPEHHLTYALSLPDRAPIPPNRLRELTFSELYRLHQSDPEQFKELHISMCIEQPWSDRFKNKKYNRFKHEDAYHGHPEFGDMPIADAVRVSMNLPWLYPVYPFTLKGKSYMGSDGGLLSNMSLSTFDKLYPLDSTLGVFYKTEDELKKSYDVTRLLVLPRSESEIKQELIALNREIAKAEQDWEKIKQAYPSYSNKGEFSSETQQYRQALLTTTAILSRVHGKRNALKRELESLSRYEHPTFGRWANFSIPDIMSRYLEKKNRETLGSTQDLRRLVMINTGRVDTKDFKLTPAQKEKQLQYGESAMTALLRGTYCLENHFYFHKLRHLSEVNGVSLGRFYRPFSESHSDKGLLSIPTPPAPKINEGFGLDILLTQFDPQKKNAQMDEVNSPSIRRR